MTKLTKNQIIFSASSPWDNPFQGLSKRVLFVCSAGILRSATMARMYAQKYNTRCAGSEAYALIKVSSDLLLWAEEIVFVNHENYLSVCRQFDLDAFSLEKKIVVLDIPDEYDHMHPDLIRIIQEQYEPI